MNLKLLVNRLGLLLFFCLASCRPQQVAVLPTLVVLPSVTPVPTVTPLPTDTPLPTPTLSPSPTLTPSLTATPDLIATRRFELELTNRAAQQTLDAMLTGLAPTSTPTPTYTPSLTITMTRTPTPTATFTPPVQSMTPTIYYARSIVNLRSCADRDCDQVAQLTYGDPVQVTGRINGEAVNRGNPVWYRVIYTNQEAFVYSDLVALVLPTPVTPTRIPAFLLPVSTVAPDYSPPVYSPPVYSPPDSGGSSGGCPGLSYSCRSLSCSEAYACLAAGNGSLDRDNDGIPCESVCGG